MRLNYHQLRLDANHLYSFPDKNLLSDSSLPVSHSVGSHVAAPADAGRSLMMETAILSPRNQTSETSPQSH